MHIKFFYLELGPPRMKSWNEPTESSLKPCGTPAGSKGSPRTGGRTWRGAEGAFKKIPGAGKGLKTHIHTNRRLYSLLYFTLLHTNKRYSSLGLLIYTLSPVRGSSGASTRSRDTRHERIRRPASTTRLYEVKPSRQYHLPRGSTASRSARARRIAA